jgi:hypothetical protein
LFWYFTTAREGAGGGGGGGGFRRLGLVLGGRGLGQRLLQPGEPGRGIGQLGLQRGQLLIAREFSLGRRTRRLGRLGRIGHRLLQGGHLLGLLIQPDGGLLVMGGAAGEQDGHSEGGEVSLHGATA